MANTTLLRVPLSKDHWITLMSNKPMTIESYRALNRWLSLQREILMGETETNHDSR